jgi:hypothetical protein
MSNIEAPVVPMKLAKVAPIPRKIVFTSGVPGKLPRITIPPEIVKSAPKSSMNERYSKAVLMMTSTPAPLTQTGTPILRQFCAKLASSGLTHVAK